MTNDPQNQNDILADFLRTDVQDYRPRIAEIHEAMVNKRAQTFTGNAFELTLSATHATIRQTHGHHPKKTLPLAAFQTAFNAWVAGLPA